MIRFGHPVEGLERLPLTAALGAIYTNKLTGTLKVHDCGGKSVPFVFWFKRGFPCHSYSRDGIARLGEQLEAGKRLLVEGFCARRKVGKRAQKQMLGQMLLSESLLTMDELQAALSRQLTARLLCCAAGSDNSLEFDEGMDEFGVVPLSSPLLNPIEVGSRAAAVGPHERIRAYLLERIEESHIRLAPDRRIPPAARQHLASQFLDSLGEAQDLGRILATPSKLRTAAFLHAFGFVETLNVRCDRPAETTAPQPAQAADEPVLDALADMAARVREDASFYELLGLPLNADRSQIKQVYRHVAFLIHPDRVPSHRIDESKLVFPRLVEAYHTLSKERLRVKYDMELVTRGRWFGLGSTEQVEGMLALRFEHLAAIGLTTLAGEYTRMLNLLGGPRHGLRLDSDLGVGSWS